MNLVDRVRNILVTPNTEWPVIAGETATLSSLLISYVVPLAAIPAMATLLSGFLVNGGAGRFILTTGVIAYVSAILSYVITTYVVDLLASTFKSEKDLNKSAQLVAYSSTASWVAGLLSIIPVIGWMGSIAGGLYAIYLMYLGVGPMKKTPEDQKIVYMAVIFFVLLASTMVLASIFGMMFLAGAIA
jgi:Yip1 domain